MQTPGFATFILYIDVSGKAPVLSALIRCSRAILFSTIKE